MAFPENGILDDFNRGDEGPPMTGWGDLINGLVVSSNACTLSAAGANTSYYDTILTDDDCEVYFTITVAPTTNRNVVVYARLKDVGSSATVDGYLMRYTEGTDILQIARLDNGSETVLGADISQSLTDGDKMGLEIVGDTLTAYVDTGGGWTSVGSRTDSTYADAGYIGAGIGGNGTIDDFGGGGLSGAPPTAGAGQLVNSQPLKQLVGGALVA